ncbi:hypothetical protein Q5741_17760 [Paenibacillus sp. JX-17]|uniref:Uncharacterized protein n=1 Tax=Paenibacillus lacisoli TaxID=3064525 RepID=A0ABT9CGC0_9BACL|nr:hypothetical protein [Paenibacillus sp. JX-17]MDO7908251.1 hypothetical protein [Paenibacillus sp. JX-17]
MNIMNMTVHNMMPFHHQYPKAQQINTEKKSSGNDPKVSFQDILNAKMASR